MRQSDVQPFLLSASFLLLVGILAALLSGCDGNHIIGDLPDVDPCLIEGVEECAPNCEVCEDRERFELQLRNERDYGFRLGVESVVCETPEETDEDSDSDRSRKPHKRTRGKGHRNHPADAIDLDSNDPLAGLLSQHCETVCTPDGLGGMSCIQTCYDRTGRRV